MKTNLLNTTKLLLLILAVAPLFAVFVFHARQKAVRSKMREELEHQLVQTITVDKADMHWTEEGKEALINNRLFDVKSFSFQNGTYTLVGLYDEEETLLVNHFQKNLDSQSNPDNKLLTQLFQLLHSFYTAQDNDQHFNSSVSSLTYRETDQPLSVQFLSISSPPPKIG